MIVPPGRSGVAFTDAGDGDLKSNPANRAEVSASAFAPTEWATVTQIHGSRVVDVDSAGDAGEADALWTENPALTVAVLTADCLGVVLHAERAVGVAHAGWRGAVAGVVPALRNEMESAGHEVTRAEIGPGIASCCFEVGPEVLERFPGFEAATSWATDSVDLVGYVRSQLDGVDLWVSNACTQHEDGWFSHRDDGTPNRMAALGWVT